MKVIAFRAFKSEKSARTAQGKSNGGRGHKFLKCSVELERKANVYFMRVLIDINIRRSPQKILLFDKAIVFSITGVIKSSAY